MKIMTHQMIAFSNSAVANFEEKLSAQLGAAYPRLAPDPDIRRDLVGKWCHEARSEGFVTRSQLHQWVMLRAEHELPLHQLSWAAPILNDRSLTPSQKGALLDERAVVVEAQV